MKTTLILLILLTVFSLNTFAADVPFTVLRGHTHWVRSVSFSPDDKTLASGSLDNTIRLWDVATGTEKAVIRGHTGSVQSVFFSQDGTLASGSTDDTIRLWDVATRTEKAVLRGHTDSVNSVFFSPDGKTLASGSLDNTIRLWDVATRTEKVVLRGHTDLVESVSFSRDGKTLASGSWDSDIRLWDVATGTEKAVLRGHARVESVSFSRDGKTLASGSWDDTIRLWDVATGTEKAVLRGHTEAVLSVSFSRDGKTLASGSWDSDIRLWDVATGTEKAVLRGHTDWVNSVSFSRDGKTLASGSLDNTIHLWDVTDVPDQSGQRPDLIVESPPRVSKTTLSPGKSFELFVTVANNGAAESAATTLRYYRSSDPKITTSDTRVGTPDSVSALDANRSSAESVTLDAPSSPGTYYYGACVESVANESDTDNNCSTAVKITVERTVTEKPDLIVERLRVNDNIVDDATLLPGESFKLSVNVKNRGSAESAATTLRYYRSSNDTISSSDTEVGNPDSVSALDANRSEDESTTLNAPTTPGTYYYGTCVESVANESDTDNNCSEAVRITVERTVTEKPDLIVELPWVENVKDRTVVIGESFKFGVTVKNIGRGQAPPTTLRYYLSKDKKITTDDTRVDTDAVGRLARNGESDEDVMITAPTTPGTYYYGACVDRVAHESNTGNNCSPGFEITVSATDDHANTRDGATILEVVNVALRGPNRIEVGNDVDYFQLIVKGSGQLTVETTGSLDTKGTLENSSGTTLAIGDDEGDGSNFRIQHRVTAGTYYLKVESYSNGIGEYTLNASLSSSNLVPDLVVRPPSVDKNTLSPGESFTLTTTVANVGKAASDSTTLRYHRSADDTFSTIDTEPDSNSIGELGTPLGGRSTSTERITLTAPTTPGTYYYRACVESPTNESNTANNCSAVVSITVRETVVLKPDLVVRSPSVDKSTLSPGEGFTLTATIANVGKAASDSTTLRYHRSAEDTFTTIDTEPDSNSIGELGTPLGGRSTSTERITLTAPTTPGTYYYRACVDSLTNESDTTNNCSNVVAVTVTSVSTVVRVTPDALTQGVGEPVTLKIDIADAQDVIGYNFTLEFDPSVLGYISSRNGNYLAGVEGTQIAVPTAKLTANSVTIGASNIQDYESDGAGTLASVTFKVRQTGTSTVKLSRTELTLKGGSNVVYPRVEHGQIIGSVSPPQQNIVRLIYFIPKDRSPQQDIDENLHDLMQDSQTFYAEQMEEKNGVRKTFTFETDSRGKAVVHYVYGQLTNDAYYDNPWGTIKSEIRDVFDTSKNLFFIVAELESERIGDDDSSTCGIGGVNYSSYDSDRQEIAYARGTALIPAAGSCFEDPYLTYHELGHAFGLEHDFRDGSYTMSYGSLLGELLGGLGLFGKSQLSSCAAEWLEVSPFFNTGQPSARNQTTTIKKLPSAADSLGTLRFEITDGDGLHQVQLIAAPKGWKPPPGYPDFTKWSSFDEKNKAYLHACKRLDGARDTFEFNRDLLSADEVMLQVIDKSGNITRQKFPLASTDDHGDTQADANPIPLGEPSIGEIATSDDADFYKIEASGPGIVTAYTTGNLDTVGELQDSSGNVLKIGDDVGDDRNFRIRHRVTAGTYYIKVSSFQAATGSYTLHANFQLSSVEDANQYIYWTTGNLGKIQRMPLDGTGTPEDLFTKADGLMHTGNLALDVAGGKIYWIDGELEKIQRGNLDGSGSPEDLFTEADGLVDPATLALDVVGRKIYWTDYGGHKIQRGNLDGFGEPEVLLTAVDKVQYPYGIALDLKNRHVYWTEDRMQNLTLISRKIRRATLDGFNVQNFVNLKLTWRASDIALDIEGGKIYWLDHLYDLVRRKNLNGLGDIETLEFISIRGELITIKLDAATHKFYWIERDQASSSPTKIRRANLDGTELEILHAGENYVADIAVGSPMENRDISWADVNRDGVVNIQDLVYIAQRYKQTGRNNADVNGDNIVNVDDFILVAAVVDGAAAAPAIRGQVLAAFTVEEIQEMLAEARLSGNTSPAYLRGIAVLEQFLALLRTPEAIPEVTSLLPNYPNPFNPETWIPYQLATPAEVTLAIYDIHGHIVRHLDFGHQRAGMYHNRSRAAYWDGTNTQGEPVASGIYFYTLKAGDFTATRKMLIRK